MRGDSEDRQGRSSQVAASQSHHLEFQECALPIEHEKLVELTTEIVAAHVGNNPVEAADLGSLIQNVFAALEQAGTPPAPPEAEKPKGAVSVRASIKPEHLVSMIDGKPYKMLKRHLSLHGYTPETYRETFGLAYDYPMVAAEYAEKRRNLAHKIGLGRKPKEEPKPAKKPRAKKKAELVATPATAPVQNES